MPIYEYKCDNGHLFDVTQRITDDPLTSCVECGAPVKKVLQPVRVAFKGSGFYSTDYSKKGPKTETAELATKNGDAKAEKPAPTEKKPEQTATTKED